MSILATFKALSIGQKILSGAAPLLIIGGAFWYHNNAVTSSYNKGYDSRNIEVNRLENTLVECNRLKDISERTVAEQSSKLIADADAYAKSIETQAKLFNVSQQANSDALLAMASRNDGQAAWMSALTEQLKGVTYVADPETGACIIKRGGIVLRNAAAGKKAN